ncbi:uncharacterized protein LOC124897956 [Capsicum annuum]|uniref:uncharacterized protein LOC124897956 n=1 Tax=Capsicum annuum TaxID=4072 RepID=UPI001FB0A98C|nr:uncharacterized protein LOC124897956 [Capsicum annuum]
MSKYAKYLKGVVTDKVKLQDVNIVELTKDFDCMVMQKMPQKLKDPERFTLLIQIGNNEVVHPMSDLGESINLMPLYFFNKLELGNPRQSSLILQLENQTLAHPEGIIEDVLIKVDEKVPVILGCPFLVMKEVLIDVREGTLIMRLDDEEVVFKVYKHVKALFHYKYLCMIIVIKEDKYGVVDLSPPKKTLNFLIEQPKP